MKKLIAFDLDDTLSITKSPISDEMARVLIKLLDHFDVCVISGGKFEQFERQVTSRLNASPDQLMRMHLMPTCGTRYYRYDGAQKTWELQYAEDLQATEKKKIADVIEAEARKAGMWPEKPYGEVIEDRDSQISISFLGQQAPPAEKYDWFEKNDQKREVVRLAVEQRLSDFEVRSGGTTSIDVTRMGIDKAYGMHKLIQALEISKDEIMFFGDKLHVGGNDYPVKAMGIDSLEVDRWEDTVLALEAILYVT